MSHLIFSDKHFIQLVRILVDLNRDDFYLNKMEPKKAGLCIRTQTIEQNYNSYNNSSSWCCGCMYSDKSTIHPYILFINLGEQTTNNNSNNIICNNRSSVNKNKSGWNRSIITCISSGNNINKKRCIRWIYSSNNRYIWTMVKSKKSYFRSIYNNKKDQYDNSYE
jgi:hypothetical protein